LKQKYPLPGEETEYDDDDVDDDYRVAAKEPIISKEQEREERTAERRGISDELVWATNSVSRSLLPGLVLARWLIPRLSDTCALICARLLARPTIRSLH